MIDRIRHDIQERLDQLLGEAEKLRRALASLGSSEGSKPTRAAQSKAQPTSPRRPTRSGTKSAPAGAAASAKQPTTARAKRQGPSRSTKSPSSGARTPSGATKSAVLAALANGEAMTASDVAAATGLGRGTVSTTLSKLAKTGEVSKAQRGYRIPQPPKPGI